MCQPVTILSKFSSAEYTDSQEFLAARHATQFSTVFCETFLSHISCLLANRRRVAFLLHDKVASFGQWLQTSCEGPVMCYSNFKTTDVLNNVATKRFF